jgi:tetratricopeptide (TPR) repeat protein
MSARSIMSRYDRFDEREYYFINDIDRKIAGYVPNQGLGWLQVISILNGCRNGLAISAKNKDMGDQKLASNELEKALKYYNEALRYYPFEPRTLINRSETKNRIGDKEGFVQDLQNALFIYPDDPIALYNRSQIYLHGKKWNEAIGDINRAFKNGAEKYEYFLARAEAYLGLGNKEKALTDYFVALERTNNETERHDILKEVEKIQSMPAN